MRKTRLELDRLTVESFDVGAGHKDGRGTVHAHGDSIACSFRNSWIDTCALSCGGSCYTGLNCHPVC